MQYAQLYDWQKEIANSHENNVAIRGGRQSGKSWAAAHSIVKFAKEFPGETQLIIAASERQENYIYEKVKKILGEKYRFKGRATMTKMVLQNDSVILKFPVGQTGIYIPGLSSLARLIVDEAHYVTAPVMRLIEPALIEPKARGLGKVMMLSNTMEPRKSNIFQDAFSDPNYKKFHIKTEDCPHINPEDLKKEKRRLTEAEYKAIWEGEFMEDGNRIFPDYLIEQGMNFRFYEPEEINKNELNYFLGVDPARFGKDETAFCIVEHNPETEKLRAVHYHRESKIKTTTILDIMKRFDEKWDFNLIFPDDGGLGGGAIDFWEEEFKSRLFPINNAAKSEDGKRILKEDLYSNAKMLIETGRLTLKYDEELRNSLQSMRIIDDKITGKNTHLVEALVRAAWGWKQRKYKPMIF